MKAKALWPVGLLALPIAHAYTGMCKTPQTACPEICIFGARETGGAHNPGFGLAGAFIDDIQKVFPNAAKEPIHYPADGMANLKNETYKLSVQYGVGNATEQISAFAEQCPDAELVLVGYSQGSKVFDDALCGGGDPNMGIYNTSATIAQYNIKAVLLPADDRFTPGEPFHVGNATHGGFDARPSNQIHCGNFDNAIQLYCDINDEFCTNGTSLGVHNGYHAVYGQDAVRFVQNKLSG